MVKNNKNMWLAFAKAFLVRGACAVSLFFFSFFLPDSHAAL